MATLIGTFTDTLSYPLLAYGGGDLAALFLNLFYQSNQNYFQGTGNVTEASMQYNYQATAAPTATLGPQGGTTPHNVTINFSAIALQVYQLSNGQRGSEIINTTLPFTAYGTLGVTHGILSFTSLTVVVDSSNFGDKIIQKMVTDYVLPSMQKLLESVTLPQLQNLFGSGISGGVEAVAIIPAPNNDYVAQIGAVLSGGGNPGNADSVSFNDLAVLNNNNADGKSATIMALVSQGTVNMLIANLLKPLKDPFDKRSKSHGWGAGARGTLYFNTPQIHVSGGRATASGRVSISLQIGVEGFGHWTWSSISVPDVNAVVDFVFESKDGINARLQLTGVESLKVDLGHWPKIFDPVKKTIEDILDAIIKDFQGLISKAVRGVNIKLFSLPDEIPGTNIKAQLSFASGGLGFYGSSVRAVINAATA